MTYCTYCRNCKFLGPPSSIPHKRDYDILSFKTLFTVAQTHNVTVLQILLSEHDIHFFDKQSKYHYKRKALPGTQEIYKRSHLVSKGKKNPKIMITNHQRRNKSSCPKIQCIEN